MPDSAALTRRKYSFYKRALDKCRKVGIQSSHAIYESADALDRDICGIERHNLHRDRERQLIEVKAKNLHDATVRLWEEYLKYKIAAFELLLDEYRSRIPKEKRKAPERFQGVPTAETYEIILEGCRNTLAILIDTPPELSNYALDPWEASFDDYERKSCDLSSNLDTMAAWVWKARQEKLARGERWKNSLKLGIAVGGGGGLVGLATYIFQGMGLY